MLVKYYRNKDLAYANRKRFKSFNYVPFYQEEQRSILLGDGSQTFVKTNKNNICDYVKIDNTRWFVTSYTYLNGGQVRLNLQRDVIGEFGLMDCFGKIERGYTDGVLKYKKELGLNQILKKRFPLKPINSVYGNYEVDNHEMEAWGLLYLVKPSGLDPNTGKPYEETLNVNIPAFRPDVSSYNFIENNTRFISGRENNTKILLNLEVEKRDNTTGEKRTGFWSLEILFDIVDNSWRFPPQIKIKKIAEDLNSVCGKVVFAGDSDFSDSGFIYNLDIYAREIASLIIIDGSFEETGFSLPKIVELSSNAPNVNYDNAVLEKDGKYYKYRIKRVKTTLYGSDNKDRFFAVLSNKYNFANVISFDLYNKENSSFSAYTDYNEDIYYCKELTGADAGDLIITLNSDFVDEPYVILAIPLFDVLISSNTETQSFSIDDSKKAFNIFNSIIEFLSGDSPYLIDAQVYPYAPKLNSTVAEIAGVPVFSVLSTNYETYCDVQLLPFKDIKKEYIERVYSIVSPDQSAKTSFNYYDYKNNIVDGVDVNLNYDKIRFVVKTALKPFSIISSCYPIPDAGSLSGINYDSKLSGCKASGNGFQASMSSSAFETYRRQNSNYQQMFQLEKDQLVESHKVEKVNETISAIVGTASVTAMGAIAGSSAADIEFMGFNFKGAGGTAGAITAGATAASAYAYQASQNEKLRDFEKKVQQQRFDLEIGTIKNIPLSVNRISTFNEIILKDFYYVVELYECTEEEKSIVDNFILKYAYSIGVFDFIFNYAKNGWFLKANLVTSNLNTNLFNVASNELSGGIYYYE